MALCAGRLASPSACRPQSGTGGAVAVWVGELSALAQVARSARAGARGACSHAVRFAYTEKRRCEASELGDLIEPATPG